MKKYAFFNKLSSFLILALVIFSQKSLAQKTATNFPEPKNKSTYVIAHRGVHNGIPENSLPAYQKAIDLGCDFIEIDARETKDGRIVSIHNSTIDAYVKGGKGKMDRRT